MSSKIVTSNGLSQMPNIYNCLSHSCLKLPNIIHARNKFFVEYMSKACPFILLTFDEH